VLLMLEVYAAGETPIPGADARSLCRSIRMRGKVDPVLVRENDDVVSVLQDLVADGDIVITQGAGSVGALARQIVERGFLA